MQQQFSARQSNAAMSQVIPVARAAYGSGVAAERTGTRVETARWGQGQRCRRIHRKFGQSIVPIDQSGIGPS